MNIGRINTDLRKQKDLSQTDLTDNSGVSSEMIGKYERGEAVPSIEAAKKIADALNVTLDYLVKDAEYKNIDNEALNRLKLIDTLGKDEQQALFKMIDLAIANKRMKENLQNLIDQ